MVAYLAILGAALCGYAGVGPWALALSAIALASISQMQYATIYKRARDLGHSEAAFSTSLQSFGNALVASGSAYAMGLVLRII
jgi:hypothetical protein